MSSGFSFIECMVTISIMAILGSFAFSALSWHHRIQAKIAAEMLMSDLILAQQKSQSSRKNIILCPMNQENTCDSTWKNTYQLYEKTTGKILYQQKLNPKIQITYQGFPNHHQIDFQPYYPQISNGTFHITYDSKAYYQIILNQAGNVKMLSNT